MKVFEKSKFIWIEKDCTPDSYGEFYFPLNYDGGKLDLNISCDSDYTLFINGKFAYCNQYGDFEHFKVYDTIDLAKHLKKGENKIAILVWYFGFDTSKYKTYNAGLIFEVKDENGNIVKISDEQVLSRKSRAYQSGRQKLITTQLGFGYKYDSTKEDNWQMGELNGFNRSTLVKKDCVFYPRPNKKLINEEKISAKLISQSDTCKIYDFGKEVFGLFYIDCDTDFDQTLSISFGEDLPNGKVARFIAERDFSFEYVAKTGKNKYTNYMLSLGCRFLQVDSETHLRINQIGVINQYYPVIENTVIAQDKDFLRIYNLCVNTLKLSMAEHYMDCPWREQALYAFDSRNQMLAGYSVFKDGNFEYAKSNLLLISQDRSEDGLLSICYPCGISLRIPAFSLYYILQIKEYLQYSNDKAFVGSIVYKLKEIIQSFAKRVENNLVVNFSGENYWNFYDWSPLLMGTNERSRKPLPDLVINCLFIIALDSFEYICNTLGEKFEYSELKNQVVKATKEQYFNVEKGLFFFADDKDEFTEVGNSLAILAGLCNQKEKEHICNEIVSGKMLQGTLSLKTIKYDALLSLGDKHVEYIKEEIKKEYLYMLDQGADCTWETIEGKKAFGEAGSLCHGWSAVPAYYLIKFGLVKVKEN